MLGLWLMAPLQSSQNCTFLLVLSTLVNSTWFLQMSSAADTYYAYYSYFSLFSFKPPSVWIRKKTRYCTTQKCAEAQEASQKAVKLLFNATLKIIFFKSALVWGCMLFKSLIFDVENIDLSIFQSDVWIDSEVVWERFSVNALQVWTEIVCYPSKRNLFCFPTVVVAVVVHYCRMQQKENIINIKRHITGIAL